MGTTLTQRDWNTLTYTLMDKHRMISTHGAAHTATAAVTNGHRQAHTHMSTVTWLEGHIPPTLELTAETLASPVTHL